MDRKSEKHDGVTEKEQMLEGPMGTHKKIHSFLPAASHITDIQKAIVGNINEFC